MDNQQNKEDLLAQLSELGIDPSSGRKRRSDKDQKRGPNSHPRIDKGIRRQISVGKTSNPLSQYRALKARLLNRSATDFGPDKDYIVQVDFNNIFVPLVKHNSQKYMNHSVVNRSKRIARTVKHVAGYTTDLEKYRFNALQYLLLDTQTSVSTITKVFLHEYLITKTDNPFDLFCALYHIAPEDAVRWSYEKWSSYYHMVSDIVLGSDFVFDLYHPPGSEEFMPELAETAEQKAIEQRLAITLSKEYKDTYARVRDLELSKAQQAIRQELLALPESTEWSMTKLERKVNEKVNKDKINKFVEEFMNDWLEQRLEEENY